MSYSLKKKIVSQLKNAFIVSCQALDNEPLHGANHMQKMVLAAVEGGANALRMNSAVDIKAARQVTDLPIIGIVKKEYAGSDIFITPTKIEIDEIASSGAEIIAIDMTARKRPTDDNLKELVCYAHRKNLLVMADLAQYSDAKEAVKAGVDFLGTTLAGYTTETKNKRSLPDFDFMEELIKNYNIPVIAEGGITSPRQAVKALELGCHAVVVGSAITRPQLIAKTYSQKIQAWRHYKKQSVIAIDLGATNIRLAIINSRGEISKLLSLKTKDYKDPTDIILAILEHIAFMIKDSINEISSISIATAGQINIHTGHVVQASASIKNWKHASLKQYIEKHTHLPCFIDNDANLALWGEYCLGVAQNKNNAVMLTLGTGLGGGIILNGKLHHGADYLAANWGQNIIYNEITKDYGPLEDIVSGNGLQNLAQFFKSPHKKGKDIILAACRGEKEAEQALNIFCQYLSQLIYNIQLTINPEIIIIGGGMSDNFGDWQKFLDIALKRYAVSTPIFPAKLKGKAGLLGAAALRFYGQE